MKQKTRKQLEEEINGWKAEREHWREKYFVLEKEAKDLQQRNGKLAGEAQFVEEQLRERMRLELDRLMHIIDLLITKGGPKDKPHEIKVGPLPPDFFK